MARLNVNPTRMELTRLKKRLVTARRGHKLLKDKRDELMRQFLEIVRQNLVLREKVEESLLKAHNSFTVASAVMSPEMLEEALMYPKQSVSLELGLKNIMSVNVPVYDFQTKSQDPSEIFPYGFATTSGELDDAVLHLSLIHIFIQIFLGMGLQGYQLIRRGQVFDAVCDIGFWFLILGGVPVCLLNVNVGLILMAVGAAGVLLTGGRAKKGLGKITGGLGSLYGITSYLSDILSLSLIHI